MNKRITIILLASLLLISLFVILFFSTFQGNNKAVTEKNLPTPTIFSIPITPSPNPPIPGQGNEYKRGVQRVNEEEKTFSQKDQNIINLKKGLPYQGLRFTLSHEMSTNKYVVTIDKNYQQEGQLEFENYLKGFSVDASFLQAETIYK